MDKCPTHSGPGLHSPGMLTDTLDEVDPVLCLSGGRLLSSEVNDPLAWPFWGGILADSEA